MDAGTCITFALLVPLLGHNDFRTRERAQAYLHAHAACARPWLEKGRKSEDPEVSLRCSVMLREQWMADLARESMPWIDCFDAVADTDWQEGVGIAPAVFANFYLRQAQLAGHDNTGPDWKCYREATRLMCMDLLRGGSSIEDVRKMTAVMQAKCDRWNHVLNRYDLPPPELVVAPKAEKE